MKFLERVFRVSFLADEQSQVHLEALCPALLAQSAHVIALLAQPRFITIQSSLEKTSCDAQRDGGKTHTHVKPRQKK